MAAGPARPDPGENQADLPLLWNHPDAVTVSSVNGRGLDQLRSAICQRLDSHGATGALVITSTANRCFESLSGALRELERASEYCLAGAGDEIVAAALRTALDELAIVTGKVFTDDILERVFSRFCIGK